MRLYVFSIDKIKEHLSIDDIDEVKCQSCGWSTIALYVLANSEDEAINLLKEGVGMCARCMTEYIQSEGFEITIPKKEE